MMRTSPGMGAFALLLTLGAMVPRAQAATVTFGDPSFDKWLYGNAGPGGTSTYAPLFSSVDNDRLGSMMTAFQTSSSIQTGKGAQNYQITSVRLKLTLINGDFTYDDTHDTVDSYLPGGVDFDPASRPIEVFGIGLHSNYNGLAGAIGTTSAYGQNTAFTTGGQPSAFPLAVNSTGQLFNAIDNVNEGLEAIPFGVGQTSLAPGASVPAETVFTFTLDIASPAVLAYLQDALNKGVLGLYISSLHISGGQGEEQTYPRFYTEEGAVEAGGPLSPFKPTLEVEYQIIPEPRISGLLIAGIALFAAGRGLRHRNRLS